MPEQVEAYHVEQEPVCDAGGNPILSAKGQIEARKENWVVTPALMYKADAAEACQKWPDVWFKSRDRAQRKADELNRDIGRVKRGPGRPRKSEEPEQGDGGEPAPATE